MKYFQHDLPKVEDYLHHRAPYLLVQQIAEIHDRAIETKAAISGDEFFAKGHFPGAPILPGAMMQEMTTQTAGILIAARFNPMERFDTHDPFFNEYALGVLVRIKDARYKSFARPGDKLTIKVELDEHIGDVFEFRGKIVVDGAEIMRNRFLLANIPSKTLQGS